MDGAKRFVKTRVNKGGRNLVFLGVISTLIALVTTGVSLLIYHNSGDIYLDRSRPGFLPDEEEVEEEAEEDTSYVFDKNGVLSVENIEEYLTKLRIEVDAVDVYEEPFAEDALSDAELGITKTAITDMKE